MQRVHFILLEPKRYIHCIAWMLIRGHSFSYFITHTKYYIICGREKTNVTIVQANMLMSLMVSVGNTWDAPSIELNWIWESKILGYFSVNEVTGSCSALIECVDRAQVLNQNIICSKKAFALFVRPYAQWGILHSGHIENMTQVYRRNEMQPQQYWG